MNSENRSLRSMFVSGGWRSAAAWGVGAALAHRLLLGLWMAGVWLLAGRWMNGDVNFHDPGGDLPALTSQAEQLIFGVWRRWDAVHYLNLARYGYRAGYPGPTVFGAATPLGFRLFDALLPGGLDLGAMVFETLAFALALALLYRVCEVYYRDAALAPWAVAALALAPLSFVFAAPLSESFYLAMTLGLFYFGARERWRLAAACGFAATLARPQGILLLVVAGILLLEQMRPRCPTWREWLRAAIPRGLPLLVIPLAYGLFELWRASLGLPLLSETYRRYSYNFFTTPIAGLLINLRVAAADVNAALRNPDMLALVISLALATAMLFFRRHRRPALIAYTWGYMLLFVSRVNYVYGTDIVMGTQSYARYSMVLFPLFVLVADGLRHAPAWGRLLGIGALLLGALGLSALNVLALLGP